MNDHVPADDWAKLRSSLGSASLVPLAIDELLKARSPQEAKDADSRLDNEVVLQGQLFSSAVPTAERLTRAIRDGDYTEFALPETLDLLAELAYGESHAWEVMLGNCDLGAQCRAVISQGIDCIKALVGHKDEKVAMEVLDLVNRLDNDPATRNEFLRNLPLPAWSDKLRQRVENLRQRPPLVPWEPQPQPITSSDKWAQLRSADGSSWFVPSALDRMLHADSPEEATNAYWELDNHVVVGRGLFEGAVETGKELIRAICARDYTRWGLPKALDLLVKFAHGESDSWEVALGDTDLGRQCRTVIAEGLDCIKALVGDRDEAVVLRVLDLVDLLDTDPDSRQRFLRPLPFPGWSATLQERVKKMRSRLRPAPDVL